MNWLFSSLFVKLSYCQEDKTTRWFFRNVLSLVQCPISRLNLAFLDISRSYVPTYLSHSSKVFSSNDETLKIPLFMVCIPTYLILKF